MPPRPPAPRSAPPAQLRSGQSSPALLKHANGASVSQGHVGWVRCQSGTRGVGEMSVTDTWGGRDVSHGHVGRARCQSGTRGVGEMSVRDTWGGPKAVYTCGPVVSQGHVGWNQCQSGIQNQYGGHYHAKCNLGTQDGIRTLKSGPRFLGMQYW